MSKVPENWWTRVTRVSHLWQFDANAPDFRLLSEETKIGFFLLKRLKRLAEDVSRYHLRIGHLDPCYLLEISQTYVICTMMVDSLLQNFPLLYCYVRVIYCKRDVCDNRLIFKQSINWQILMTDVPLSQWVTRRMFTVKFSENIPSYIRTHINSFL